RGSIDLRRRLTSLGLARLWWRSAERQACTGHWGVYVDTAAVVNLSGQQQFRERRLNFPLDGPLQGPCAVTGIEAFLTQKSECFRRDLNFELPLGEARPQTLQLDVDDPLQVLD